VAWGLPAPSDYTIGIYDLAGRQVCETGGASTAGVAGTASFDGTGSDGGPLAAGCYLIRLSSDAGSAVSRVVILGD
jgi:hypothetical protein